MRSSHRIAGRNLSPSAYASARDSSLSDTNNSAVTERKGPHNGGDKGQGHGGWEKRGFLLRVMFWLLRATQSKCGTMTSKVFGLAFAP